MGCDESHTQHARAFARVPSASCRLARTQSSRRQRRWLASAVSLIDSGFALRVSVSLCVSGFALCVSGFALIHSGFELM